MGRKSEFCTYTLEGCTATKNQLNYCPYETNSNLGLQDMQGVQEGEEETGS